MQIRNRKEKEDGGEVHPSYSIIIVYHVPTWSCPITSLLGGFNAPTDVGLNAWLQVKPFLPPAAGTGVFHLIILIISHSPFSFPFDDLYHCS